MDHAQHDRFHPVTSDDPAWIETVWFPFFVPEAALTTYVRVVFQPNGECYAGSVATWSGANALRFEAPFEGGFKVSRWSPLVTCEIPTSICKPSGRVMIRNCPSCGCA